MFTKIFSYTKYVFCFLLFIFAFDNPFFCLIVHIFAFGYPFENFKSICAKLSENIDSFKRLFQLFQIHIEHSHFENFLKKWSAELFYKIKRKPAILSNEMGLKLYERHYTPSNKRKDGSPFSSHIILTIKEIYIREEMERTWE